MKKFLLMSVGILCVLFIFAGTPSAMNLSFDQLLDGGTLSYDGIGGALIGRDINFDVVIGNGTPSNAGVSLTITDGSLNFSTGSNLTEGPIYTWAAGGSFILTGNIAAQSGFAGTSGVLVAGSFTGIPLGSGSFSFLGDGIDEKNSDLIDFYGLGAFPGFEFANTEISTAAFDDFGDGFLADVTEADIVNTPVPEPASMLLTGLGLFGMGFYLRRRFKKA
jgi:hypothetical protein